MIQNSLVLCALMGFIAWYYFTKYQESEREFTKLHRQFVEVCSDNDKVKNRVSDLQTYKNDISKTFEILDNEFLMIKDMYKTKQLRPNSDNVSILTPEILNTLFNNNQEVEQIDTNVGEISEIQNVD